MNKETLKEYLKKYGELKALKDIASILHDLGKEWAEDGDKKLGHVFSYAANMIADVSSKLENAELTYMKENDFSQFTDNEKKKIEVEFNNLTKYFQSLSLSEVKTLWIKNQQELISKIKRMEFLKRLLDKKSDDQK